MVIAGIQKSTLLDFPGEIASTLFTLGCNLRCPYCHNPELVESINTSTLLSWDTIIKYLKKRKNVLGGVCITGGEPLLTPQIEDIIKEIHNLGLKVKIDTNGTLPETLKNLRVDFVDG